MPITKYHIGCTAWSLREWVGTFFTNEAKQEGYLPQYASVFNSVEGNTSFYHVPKSKTVKKWKKQTPDGFKFCFKFHRSITHDKQLQGAGDDILQFLEVFDPIADRLGPFHIQLPPDFSPQKFQRLEETLVALPSVYSYAVEVRHPGFYDHGREENRLTRLLRSLNINCAVFDTRKLHSITAGDASIREAQRKKPKLPVRFSTTGSRPFIRFVGANDPLNNEPYLKEWAIVVADWIKEGLHPYIFTHSPDMVSQAAIGRRFHHILSELIDMNPMPPWPIERMDKQLDLF